MTRAATAWALAVLGMGLACCHLSMAAPPPKNTSAAIAASASSDGSNTWAGLSGPQRRALQPLAALWPTMEISNKQRWVNVANRFGSLSPQEQQRMQERMTQWSKLPPQQRGEARLRFQQTRQLSPEERQKKWASYQALSPEERGELAQQARRKQQPVVLSDNMAGPRERAQQASKRLRDNESTRKSNWVPGATANAPAQVAVAPSLIKAGRGATTTLVSQRPTPPLHQQTGLPKIAATKGFVDPVTLLPKKGAQGAAMTTVPASQSR
ncbi:MAG: DUF3106 domain-containing protein [Aquabacterium sp.]|uniref:DUF3106 domain-containing protein n=1 Tax=Aquabacterium sp. TaxID=1872578 RepID=UPI00271979E6|nr:DUF3106 domain-containing protein [Aquabacterium sp.]MDO9004568.1 DUF3106 domain-containing protein [Aquabacterium sp.]